MSKIDKANEVVKEQDVMSDYRTILQNVIKEFNFEDWRAVIRTDSWHIVEERCKALPNFEKNSYNDWVKGFKNLMRACLAVEQNY